MMATNLAANADRHKRFFEELETRASILTTITKLHKNIAGHFATLEQSVSQKSQALDSEIEAFNSQNNITHQSLSNRENSLPEIESSEAVRVNEKKDAAMSDIENAEGKGEENGERSLSESLRMYCRRMDSIGLMRFLFAKRKESGVWRTELSLALEEAVDTMTLVLDAIEDFLDMKKDVRGGIAERRRSCGILIQEAIPLGGSYFGAVATSVKERAVKVLERWRKAEGRSGLVNSNGMVPGEVAMFLHTVVRFGVKDYFEKDFLSNLVMEHSSRRDIPKVAAALGLGDKMKDIINELVKSGKEIEAIYFAHESGLTDQFPPVDLLKSCLDNVCKRSINVSNDSKSSVYAMEDANNEELTVTKAILKCVEDLKLEQRYSTECLMKKIAEMEKDREERKKTTSVPPTGNPSGKRSNRGRGGGGGIGGGRSMTGPSPSFRSAKSAKIFNRTRRSPSFNSRIPNSSNQAPRTVGQYIYTSHGTYDGVSSGASSSYLLGHNPSPATLPPQYSYVPPLAATPTETSSSYGQTMYSGYDYGALDPSSYPQYQQ
ncbi:FRIGIDA-like protein 4a [Impatiens glandulifera]|uniref:FRIGIDA-like protein 4a n=1 Tax=Impatiens glandulifera TaxID=253017 RepID=UPI001FB14AFE|nr:FRIGIDA-like protein 4a [Impatiens glandulifera]